MALTLFAEMPAKQADASVVSYGAAISDCEKVQCWEMAIALFKEMPARWLDADVVVSYNVTISACEKGRQWAIALSRLAEVERQQHAGKHGKL